MSDEVRKKAPIPRHNSATDRGFIYLKRLLTTIYICRFLFKEFLKEEQLIIN